MNEYIRREDATKIILEYVTRQERIGRYAVTIHELKQNTADILGELPSDDVLPYSIDTDGTLTITVPKGMKVGRVLVQEEGTKFGGLFYAE